MKYKLLWKCYSYACDPRPKGQIASWSHMQFMCLPLSAHLKATPQFVTNPDQIRMCIVEELSVQRSSLACNHMDLGCFGFPQAFIPRTMQGKVKREKMWAGRLKMGNLTWLGFYSLWILIMNSDTTWTTWAYKTGLETLLKQGFFFCFIPLPRPQHIFPVLVQTPVGVWKGSFS